MMQTSTVIANIWPCGIYVLAQYVTLVGLDGVTDPSCMGGLSLLLMAGEQTLHNQGHSSLTSGHDPQNPGHDSQIPGQDSQSAGHTTLTDTQTQSTREKVINFKVFFKFTFNHFQTTFCS